MIRPVEDDVIRMLVELIIEELARLGCREIPFSVETGSSIGLFRRGDELIRLRLERAKRAQFVVPSYAGDDAAWAVLRAAIGGEGDGARR